MDLQNSYSSQKAGTIKNKNAIKKHKRLSNFQNHGCRFRSYLKFETY
jgi:hypothetical protein